MPCFVIQSLPRQGILFLLSPESHSKESGNYDEGTVIHVVVNDEVEIPYHSPIIHDHREKHHAAGGARKIAGINCKVCSLVRSESAA